MKIGVVGTGAIGCYYGGYLAQYANAEVIFLTKAKYLEQLNDKGITVIGTKDHFHIKANFTEEVSSFSDVDFVLICVKSKDTHAVVRDLLPVLKKDVMILTLQNGVDNEELLSHYFDEKQLFSAAAYIQAHMNSSVTVEQIGNHPFLVLGSLHPSSSKTAEQIAALFQNANIKTNVSNHIIDVKWKKLIWNITFNPLSALMEVKVGTILEEHDLQTVATDICKEAINVAIYSGIQIEETFLHQIMQQGELAKNHKTSMLQDKLNKKPLELESICGYVINKGKEHHLQTPTIQTIYHLLRYSEHV